MSRLFAPTFNPALSNQATFMGAAKLTFYLADTTTPTTAYSNAELTAALGSVVTADAFGRFVQIYLDESIAYRCILTDKNGAVLPNGDVTIPVVENFVEAQQAAATAIAEAQDAVTAAEAAASDAQGSADIASSAAMSSGGQYYPAARSNIPRGVIGTGTLTPGSGGTNGTFALAFSGGNFSANPTGTFTVAGGVVTAVSITGPGLYIGASPTAPTANFAASTGLTGAAVILTVGVLVPAGEYYLTDSTSGTAYVALFQNIGGVATQVTDPLPWASAGVARDWAQSPTAPDPADATSKSAKTIAAEMAATLGSLYISGVEAIGRPTGATLVDGTASNTQQFFFLTAVQHAGDLVSVDLFDKGAGAAEVAVYRYVSGTLTRQGTRALTLTGTGTAHTVALASSIGVLPGDILAIRSGGTGARFAFIAATADGAGYYHGATGAFPTTVTIGTVITSVRWSIRFNINWSEQVLTGPNFVALESQVDTLSDDVGTNTSTLALITELEQEIVGRATLTPTGQPSANVQQIYFLDLVQTSGTLDSFDLVSNTVGQAVIAVYRLVGGVMTLQTTRSFTVSSTGIENNYAVGIPVMAGDMLAIVGGANGVLAYSSGVVGSGEWHGANGLSFPTTVTTGSATSIYIQIRWNLSHIVPKVPEEAFDSIKAQLAPRASPIASNLPVVTDGRALYAWKGKLAQYRYAGTGLLRVVMTGDSWHEYYRIPQAMANLLYAATAKAGDGWISINVINANNLQALNGITQSKSNWTYYDASTNTAPPASGCGWDGQAIYTTGTTATITTANVVCTEYRIYYYKGTGSFRYQVDGGAWTTVTPDGSGTLGVVAITGLSNSAHSIVIDTSVNSGAGTVSLYGFYAKTAAAGVEVMKAGNASATGQHYSLFADTYIAPIATVLPPDVVIVALGTNDYRTSGATPATLITALGKIVTAYRAANANCGFIFIAPAQTNSGVVLPLSQYRDAIYQFCIANGHEFYNMYDEWSTWAIENAAGQFLDTLHPGDWGSYRLTARVKSQLLDF